MKGTPCQAAVRGLFLKPIVLTSSAQYGAELKEPWKIGRYMTITLVAAAMASTDALTMKIQLKRLDTAAWVDAVEYNGTTTPLQFTASKTADAGALENGAVVGSIDFERLKGPATPGAALSLYTHIRLAGINGVTQNVTIAATYDITELYNHPATLAPGGGAMIADDLLAKQLPSA